MKKALLGLFWAAGAALGAATVVLACVDYSDPNKDAGAPGSTTQQGQQQPAPSGAGTSFAAPPPDAANTCANRAYRGGSPNSVVCPGTPSCECDGPSICCMQRLDANSGTCTALASCRNIAIQCDGPEDCGGGVCCLDDRSGGGSSCKAAGSCTGEWLCRTDDNCVGSPRGPHCAPIDLGVQGVDDKGLDGIVGICTK